MNDTRPLITVSFDKDKFPHLDLPEDLEDVTVKMAKNALMDYMIAAWGMYFAFWIHCWLTTKLEHARPSGFPTSIPWTSLKSAQLRLFADPDRLATFPHLDPAQLSGDEAFRLLRLVGDAQMKDEVSPLKFSVTVETINALGRRDEIGDSTGAPLSPTKTMGPRGSSTASEPVSGGSETAVEVLISPTKITSSRHKQNANTSPPVTADHTAPSSKPTSDGAETAIDASRSPSKTMGSRSMRNPQ